MDVSLWGIEENIRGLFSQFILHTIYWYKPIFNIKNCEFFCFLMNLKILNLHILFIFTFIQQDSTS